MSAGTQAGFCGRIHGHFTYPARTSAGFLIFVVVATCVQGATLALQHSSGTVAGKWRLGPTCS